MVRRGRYLCSFPIASCKCNAKRCQCAGGQFWEYSNPSENPVRSFPPKLIKFPKKPVGGSGRQVTKMIPSKKVYNTGKWEF